MLALGTLVLSPLDASFRPSSAPTQAPLLLSSLPGATYYSAEGFDACPGYNHSDMQTMWNNTSAYYFGTYLGGLTAQYENCYIPDSTWYTQQLATGWGFSLLYDGFQDPCSGSTYTFPVNNPAADATDGRNAANNAMTAALNLGFTTGQVYLWYDMEGFTQTSACVSAMQSFMQAYTSTIQQVSGTFTAAMYGSSVASDPLAMLSVSPHPAYYWLADYDGDPNVYNFEGHIPTTIWVNHQRMKQYESPAAPYGPVIINGVDYYVDRDCSDSSVQGQYSKQPGC